MRFGDLCALRRRRETARGAETASGSRLAVAGTAEWRLVGYCPRTQRLDILAMVQFMLSYVRLPLSSGYLEISP